MQPIATGRGVRTLDHRDRRHYCFDSSSRDGQNGSFKRSGKKTHSDIRFNLLICIDGKNGSGIISMTRSFANDTLKHRSIIKIQLIITDTKIRIQIIHPISRIHSMIPTEPTKKYLTNDRVGS
jgi:hypothetical protein